MLIIQPNKKYPIVNIRWMFIIEVYINTFWSKTVLIFAIAQLNKNKQTSSYVFCSTNKIWLLKKKQKIDNEKRI